MKVSISVCHANHVITSSIFERTWFSIGTTTSQELSLNDTSKSHTLTSNVTGCCKIPSRAHLYHEKTASMEVRSSRLQPCYNTFAWHWMDSNKISPRRNFVDSFWILQAHSAANISKLSVSKRIDWAHIKNISENYLGQSLYIALEVLKWPKYKSSHRQNAAFLYRKVQCSADYKRGRIY